MTNRTEKQQKDLLKVIEGAWKTTIKEQEFLEEALEMIRNRDISKYIFYENWDDVLNEVPNYKIRDYATEYLDLVEECDENELSDDEIEDKCFRRFSMENNVVFDMQIQELFSNFLSADFNKREEILKHSK
jgi:hypothetical protein